MRLPAVAIAPGEAADPGPQLIERLHQGGVPTLRTDTNGAVHILTDGNNLEVSCFVACPEISADQFNEAADATGSAEQSATINNRALPGIRDFSCIARVKTVPRSRLAFSPQ
jgi:glycosyltransferase involved in cell wall biosynthesis